MIKFNVGGRLFETTPSTIACGGADSLLSALSAGYDFSAGCPIFVDRDPDIYSVLLNLLGTNRLPVSSALFRKFTKRELIDEAAFYGLEAHLRSASSLPVLSGIDAQKICTVSPKLQPIPTSFSASGDNSELLIAHAGLVSTFDSSLSATGIFRTHLDRITCLHRFSPKTAAAGSTHAPGIHFYNIASGRLVGSLNWEDETDLRVDKSCVTAIASSPDAVFAGFESPHKENCVLIIDPPTLKPISVINRQSGSSSKTMAVGKLKFLPSSGLLVGSAVKSGSFGTSGYIAVWDVRSAGESVWEWSEPGSGRSNRFLDPFSDVDADDETGGIYKVCSRSGDVTVADLRILGRVDLPWVYLEEKNPKLRNCGDGEDSVICCYKREQVFVSRRAVVNGDHVVGSLEVWSGSSSSSSGETEEQFDHHETDRSALRSKSYRSRNYVEREGGSCKKVRKMECGGERLFVSRVGLEGVEVWESRVSIDFERLAF